MNRYKIVISSMSVFLFILLSNYSALALTAKEIIEKSDQIMQGTTQAAIFKITVKTRRWTRTMKMKSYMVRKERKSFSEILSPKKDAGNRFLLLDKLMWHYVPKLEQTIKISPSMMLQSWMGSDFTNDDIVKESSILEDYTHHMLGSEETGGFPCHKIELKPKSDAAVVWGKMIYFARIEDLLAVRVEFYNEHNELKKLLTYSDFKFMHDRIIPVMMKMETINKKDRYTIMEIENIKFDIPIPDKFFSLQNLKRR